MKVLFKYSDKLLIILTLAFLTTVLFRIWANLPAKKAATPIIVLTVWENDLMAEELKTLIEEFESIHNEIKIDLNAVSYEALRRDLFDPGEISSPKDVLMLDLLWVSELLEREIIENTNAPVIKFNNILYYNIDILRETGFSRPPKSRGEFLSYARTLAGLQEVHPAFSGSLALGLNSSRGIFDDIFPWIWSSGVKLIENGKPMVNSRPVIESLSFLAVLNNEGLISRGAFSADSAKKLEDFISTRAAFIIAPSSEISFVRECLGDEAFGVTSIPLPDNYSGISFGAAAGRTFAVYSGSAYKDESRLFLDFLAGEASFLSGRAGLGNGLPFAASSSSDDFYAKVLDITIASELTEEFTGLPWTKLEESFKEELFALFEGKSSVLETVAEIQKKWEAILE